MEFKVGDRVKHDEYGTGTVVETESGIGRDSILVQFDKTDPCLHDGNGLSKNGPYKKNSCWYFFEGTIQLKSIQEFTKSELENSKIKIEIKNRWTGSILFSFSYSNNTVKNTVEEAINQGADLCRADLREANLCIADLHGADLRETNLSRADLYGADLSRANLCGADLHGANLREADLRETNLSGADLCRADLCGADLQGADLQGANLREANLYGADLCGANLREANLYEADLRGANLCKANLHGADLHGADLRGANLYGADLSEADLSGADLSGADLNGADLNGAKYNENTAFYALQCPETGSFIGYKICENHKIVKLLITEDSKRSSATTRKCRASKVKVLEITNIENTEKYETAISKHDANFIYEVGKTIEIENFDEDRWNECSEGIHFFITRDEAVQYD